MCHPNAQALIIVAVADGITILGFSYFLREDAHQSAYVAPGNGGSVTPPSTKEDNIKNATV